MEQTQKNKGLFGGLLRLARPWHWIKNILIFLPVLFSKNLFDGSTLLTAALGFFAFCFLASFVYVFNDIKDADADRLHERKKNRPIASGRVSKGAAAIFGGALLALAVLLQFLCSGGNALAWVYFGGYLLINLAYSLGLKNLPLVDVTLLMAGFVLRVLYGGAITGIAISQWLYLVVISFSFFLSFSKRRNELIKVGAESRAALKGYTHNFLDKTMYLCLGLTIVFYSLWCLDAEGASGALIWTIPIVLIICMRYLMDIEGDSHGDPVEVLLSDKLLIALVLIYGIVLFFVLYGAQLFGG